MKEISADGFHRGLNDMCIDEDRQILGEQYIIGGTANKAEQAIMHYKRSADYVGCGPFRFTTTKQNLASILGLEGLHSVMSTLIEKRITMPVVAIGGIEIKDLNQIMTTNVDGVAISGVILNATDPTAEMQRFVQAMNVLASKKIV